MTPAETVFLDFSCKKLEQMADRVVTCLDAMSDEQIWQRVNANSNAAGNLVLHLAGNVRQWVIGGVGGAPDVRERDLEFAARYLARDELKQILLTTVQEARITLQAVEDLTRTIEVQGFRLTVLEAIYHVVEHFSGHTGQVILLAKASSGQDLQFYSYLSGAHETETP